MAEDSLKSVSSASKVDTGITAAKRKQVAETLSQALADNVYTADMLTARIGKHGQNAWMLRSMQG